MYEILKLVELIFGLSNALIGFSIVFYVARFYDYENKVITRIVKKSLAALIFLSFFSLFHFTRELFELKDIYGPIVEIPEYIAILMVFLSLVWQLVIFDTPINKEEKGCFCKIKK